MRQILFAAIFGISGTGVTAQPGPAPVLISAEVGSPAPRAGSVKATRNGTGIQIQGYGSMFGMHNNSDNGHFSYTKIRGDFDIIVQVDSVWNSTRSYGEGGLMVRRDLTPGSPMVAMFVANNNTDNECDQFTSMWRIKDNTSIEPFDRLIDDFYGPHTFGTPDFGYGARGYSMNNMPKRPYPWVWLRIIRQGNVYKTFRRMGSKEDWGKWEKLAEVTVVLGEEPLVGFALSANHHGKVSGTAGDPLSISTIDLFNISGFPLMVK